VPDAVLVKKKDRTVAGEPGRFSRRLGEGVNIPYRSQQKQKMRGMIKSSLDAGIRRGKGLTVKKGDTGFLT